MKFYVPVLRKTLDTYIVEAKSGTDAAVQVGIKIAGGAPADRTTDQGYSVLTAHTEKHISEQQDNDLVGPIEADEAPQLTPPVKTKGA